MFKLNTPTKTTRRWSRRCRRPRIGISTLLAVVLSMLTTMPSTPQMRAQMSNAAFTPYWSSPEIGNTRSEAWGDVDNDGNLDLALGLSWRESGGNIRCEQPHRRKIR